MLKRFLKIQIIERVRLFSIFLSRTFYNSDAIKIDGIKRKFIFNTQYIHAFSELEFMSAAQLKLQGHEVLVVICDGLPYTEREIVDLPRIESFKSCSSRTQRYCRAYGIPFITINSFLTKDEKRRSRKLSLGSMVNLQDYKWNDINLGEFAKRNHSHYFKGDINPEGDFEDIYRKAFEAACLIEISMSKILKKYHDYDLVTANGKFIQSGIPVELAKNSGKSFYTYEVFNQGNGVIVDKNRCSLEQGMDDVWSELKKTELNQEDLKKLYHSFDLQQKSISLDHDLWDENRIDDEDEITTILGLDLTKKIIACYPNVYWDSVHMGISSVSTDLTQWLVDMISFASSNREIQLIIRTHPGELRVADIIKSKFTMVDTINEAFKKIPSNVFVIEPDSNISSYSVAKIADANLVWNGTIGQELALRGIKPVVVANAYYANKGFTSDFLDFEELTNYLLEIKRKPRLNEEEKRLAEIFSYNVRFNRKFNAPFYLGTRCHLFNYSKLSQGNHKTLDNLVDFFLDHKPYLNIGTFDFE